MEKKSLVRHKLLEVLVSYFYTVFEKRRHGVKSLEGFAGKA